MAGVFPLAAASHRTPLEAQSPWAVANASSSSELPIASADDEAERMPASASDRVGRTNHRSFLRKVTDVVETGDPTAAVDAAIVLFPPSTATPHDTTLDIHKAADCLRNAMNSANHYPRWLIPW
jgi:hypothetical protein